MPEPTPRPFYLDLPPPAPKPPPFTWQDLLRSAASPATEPPKGWAQKQHPWLQLFGGLFFWR